MYRIRRESGEEVTLGSIDEFGAAVAAGVVTAKAEIFHARAEKWLPIASHPHFKMAHDRVTASASPKSPPKAPAVTASAPRPALGASGQRPVAPQLKVMRPDAAVPAAPVDAAVAQKPAPRWNSAQRPAARAVAPKPSAPAAAPVSDLRLVRADTLLSAAATAPALPEIEFELLPEIEAPQVAEAVAAAPAPVVEPVVVAPVSVAPAAEPAHVTEAVAPEPVVETVVERTPANVELVSHEEQPAAVRGDVEIINPDRSMPVVPDREVSSLDIPAPIRDFSPVDAAPEQQVAKPASKTPLFVGLGLVAAAAAVIGFFVLKPSGAAPVAATQTVSTRSAPAPVASQPEPVPAPSAPVVTTTMPTGASTGLGGDVQVKKPKKQDAGASQASDGLEPPPEVIPAAPTLGKIGDAAALPTVDVGVARNDAMARAQALEKARRAIDSSMRTKADSQ
jgi:hypothetical protein